MTPSSFIHIMMQKNLERYISLEDLTSNLAFKGQPVSGQTFKYTEELPDFFHSGTSKFDKDAPLLIAVAHEDQVRQLNTLLADEESNTMLLWLDNDVCKPAAKRMPIISNRQIMEMEEILNWQDMKAAAQHPDRPVPTRRRGLLARFFG